MKRPLKVGIVGYGIMGQTRLRVLKEFDKDNAFEFNIKAISEPDNNLWNGIPRDVHVVSDSLEVIDDPDIDIVFICVPNYLIKDYVIRALSNGKHVFCEKPPGINYKEAIEMKDVEKQCRGKLMFGFNHRHHESMIYAKSVIDSGELGNILWMRGRYGKAVKEDFYETWRSKKALAGGGIFLDQGIHMLDLFLMMCGDFDEAIAYVSSLFWKIDVEDNVFAIFKNKKGQVASLHSTMTQWRHLFAFEIFLEKGHIVINGLLTNSGSYGQEQLAIVRNLKPPVSSWTTDENYTYTIDLSWKSEMSMFLDSIINNKPVPIGNSDDACKLMRLVDMVYANR